MDFVILCLVPSWSRLIHLHTGRSHQLFLSAPTGRLCPSEIGQLSHEASFLILGFHDLSFVSKEKSIFRDWPKNQHITKFLILSFLNNSSLFFNQMIWLEKVRCKYYKIKLFGYQQHLVLNIINIMIKYTRKIVKVLLLMKCQFFTFFLCATYFVLISL